MDQSLPACTVILGDPVLCVDEGHKSLWCLTTRRGWVVDTRRSFRNSGWSVLIRQLIVLPFKFWGGRMWLSQICCTHEPHPGKLALHNRAALARAKLAICGPVQVQVGRATYPYLQVEGVAVLDSDNHAFSARKNISALVAS